MLDDLILLDIDLLNFDDNTYLFCGDNSKELQNVASCGGMVETGKPFDNLIPPSHLVDTDNGHSSISDSTLLCKYCYGPVAIYMLNFNRALKLCTNSNVNLHSFFKSFAFLELT